jgi:Ca2+-transporting ATPase
MTDESGREVVRCFVKGAPDQLLARAATVFDADTGPVPADAEFRRRYLAENQALAEQGLRVMATARKDFDPGTFDSGKFDSAADLLPLVEDLELLALVGILDPPRPAAKAAITKAKAAGIRIRMITGDHAVTAAAIADRLGIEGLVMTGADFAAMSDDEASHIVDDIGVIARVTPEDKVRLVELLRKQGHIVAMTGDGVNDAPALKKADIGIAMGVTGTEVTKQAAVMILTDDDFSTIVKAVQLGRGLYDNLVKYVRYQMGTLFGFIFSFLGASVFNILSGVPFLPLQTLWVNFTTGVIQSIGLGYGKPAAGLMEREPRRPSQPILPRGQFVWLVTVGLVMAAGTLGAITWAQQQYDETMTYTVAHTVPHTVGLVTFSLFNLFFSITAKDELRSVFTLDTFADKPFAIATGISVLATVLATVFGPLQALLDTTALTLQQWLGCIAVALSIVIVSEVRKVILRRRQADQVIRSGG